MAARELDDRDLETNLLADDDAWDAVGRELRSVDPHRYLALLNLAEDIVNIHRDPLRAKRSVGVYSFRKSNQRLPD